MTTKLGRERWSYNYRLEQLENAYRASRASFDKDARRIESDFQKNRETASENEYAEEYEVHLIDLNIENDEAIRLVRESFALAIHHFWERSVMSWLQKGRYDFAADKAQLQASGYVVDGDLDRLRMVANTIKHNSKVLYETYAMMFDSSIVRWIEDGATPAYQNFLRLTDHDINAFFEALHKSGPNTPPTIGF